MKLNLNRIKLIATTLFYYIIISSCKQIDLHEQNIAIPKNNWYSNLNSTSTFEIKDTTVKYNLYVVIRHTDAYEYSNIWLSVGLQQPGETMQFQKLNLTLANDAKGWKGIGMNDIWEVRIPITLVPTKFKRGTHTTSVGHVMRQNPLQHIMNVGIRVEKAGE